ncbi:MAG: biopolymer transporter ExbD [Methylacidiphilales bacterium]|nr:biopolymer transporter ExbD [Candidatus Methylacidiphilales bacterium]MDW8349139.1 biopolymer transporter ExbD [Verrucomicrobiae bacterium]
MSVEFHRPASSPGAMNLTPLIDVVFQLLIFFMLTSSFVYPALDLKLPRAETRPSSPDAQMIVISLDAQNRLFVNREEVSEAELERILRERLQHVPQQAVFFRGDRATPYERFTEIMQIATRAGARSFNLIHEPNQ